MTEPQTSDAGELSAEERLAEGDPRALASLLARHRDKLWRMAHFRLDPRIAARVDADDVLQEAWVEADRRLPLFRDSGLPAFVWLRRIVGQTMIGIHRRHLGGQKRCAAMEVSLFQGVPAMSSEALSLQLAASQTSPSQAAIRAEALSHVAAALSRMSEIDREILTMRHFEELSNDEIASILGMKKTATSNRYVRAVARLQDALEKEDPDGSLR